MKRLFFNLAVIVLVFAAVSCGSDGYRRIVSQTPIKTEVLGLNLCEESSERAIKKAIYTAADNNVYTDNHKDKTGSIVRVVPHSLELYYGSYPWMYVDVYLNGEGKITEIQMTASFESVEMAMKRYKDVVLLFEQKYGKGNVSPSDQLTFWTDDINSVGVKYEESSAINGNDRSFCTLYYVNIELADA